MTRTLRTIRRCHTAALHAGRHLVTAVRGAHYRLLVRLYAAIDAGELVRIVYRDEDGTVTARAIRPQRLWISGKGRVLVTCFDHLRQDRRDFRTDRVLTAA